MHYLSVLFSQSARMNNHIFGTDWVSSNAILLGCNDESFTEKRNYRQIGETRKALEVVSFSLYLIGEQPFHLAWQPAQWKANCSPTWWRECPKNNQQKLNESTTKPQRNKSKDQINKHLDFHQPVPYSTSSVSASTNTIRQESSRFSRGS